MAERLCPSAFNRAERAMIEGAERRQRTLVGFPGASHVLSKLPFMTTPRCPVVLPGWKAHGFIRGMQNPGRPKGGVADAGMPP